jgi:hypothetical protein
MAIAYFASLSNADIVEIALIAPQGAIVNLRLLVDTGFAGSSSLLLSFNVAALAIGPAFPGHAYGAIHGLQSRVVVVCGIPSLSYQATAVAMLADLAPINLPPGVDGLAGLQFLRQFQRWGSEKQVAGSWRFFLEK